MTGVVSSLINHGGRVDYERIAVDAFGNALGNSLAEVGRIEDEERTEQLQKDLTQSGQKTQAELSSAINQITDQTGAAASARTAAQIHADNAIATERLKTQFAATGAAEDKKQAARASAAAQRRSREIAAANQQEQALKTFSAEYAAIQAERQQASVDAYNEGVVRGESETTAFIKELAAHDPTNPANWTPEQRLALAARTSLFGRAEAAIDHTLAGVHETFQGWENSIDEYGVNTNNGISRAGYAFLKGITVTVDNASSGLANLGRFGVNQAYRDQVIDNVSHFATALVHHPLDTVHRVEQAIDNLSIEEQGQLAISILSTGGEGLVTKVGGVARLGGRLGAKGLEGAVNVARAAASAEGDALLFANSADRIGARSLALQTGGIRLTEVYKAEQATAKAADIAGGFTPIRFADDGRVFALVPTEEGATSLSWTPTEKLLAEPSEISAGTTAMRNVGRESMTTGATGVADDTIVPDSVRAGKSGAYFFDEQVLPYIDREDATLGQRGTAQFFMPSEDSTVVTDTASAYRYSGGAPSLERAYVNGGNVYGVEFPLDGLSPRLPTAADTTLEHFLEGGHTALMLPDNGGYLINPTREFVIPGGGNMPSGSVLFRIAPDGSRVVIRSW